MVLEGVGVRAFYQMKAEKLKFENRMPLIDPGHGLDILAHQYTNLPTFGIGPATFSHRTARRRRYGINFLSTRWMQCILSAHAVVFFRVIRFSAPKTLAKLKKKKVLKTRRGSKLRD